MQPDGYGAFTRELRTRRAHEGRVLGLVAVLLALAAAGWWSSLDQMQGIDAGPWTGLGTFSWFLGVWIVMMAAMMLPSAVPTVALYARLARERASLSSLLFGAGYLLAWAATGVIAFAIADAGGLLWGGATAWDRAGRWLAAAVLAAAAVYQVTPLKDACLRRCRSPIGFLPGAWRGGPLGAVALGARNGAWCLGCCWALMASLFALGIMSAVWMAVVAALVAAEKLLPWRRVAVCGTGAVLLAFAVLLAAAPDALPGLTVPGSRPPAMEGRG